MKSNNERARAQLRSLCARLHSDDGPSPARREGRSGSTEADHKTLQLCAQVRRALYGVIPLPGDRQFEGVRVETVEPAPDATRVRVALSLERCRVSDVPALSARLDALSGFIRAQVAREIHRKRVPLLTFELVPREDEP